MVADLVTLGVGALEYRRRLVRGDAGHEERRGHVLDTKNVENGRREARVGSVVEGERDLTRRVSLLLDAVGVRICREALLDDRSGGRIAANLAPPGLRGAGDLPDVAVADGLRAFAPR